MTSDGIPHERIEQLSIEVFQRLGQQLTDPIIVIVEVDADLRARAVEAAARAGRRRVPVIAAADEQQALAAVTDRPVCALWLCESPSIDGQRILAATRQRCPLAHLAVRAAAVPLAPTELWWHLLGGQPPLVLAADDLMALFPRLARGAIAAFGRCRADLVRAEVAHRLLECHPADAVSALGFAIPPMTAPQPIKEVTDRAVHHALKYCDFNKAAAARALEISRTTMDGHCERLGLARAKANEPRSAPLRRKRRRPRPTGT